MRHRRGQFAAHHMLVVDHNQRVRRDLLLQHRKAACGDAVGIGHKHDDRRDVAPGGFLQETDFLGHLEECVESVEAEIDHFGDAVVDDQPVHELHLAVGVRDVGRLGDARQVFEQRRFLQIDVEGGHPAVLQQQELAHQSREQRLADQRTGRADDVDRRRAHHPLYQENFSPNPAPSRRLRDLFFTTAHAGLGADEIGQLDAVELAPDIGEPVPDIAAQHEGIIRGLVVLALVGDEFEERHRGDLDLLIGHFVELGDDEVGGVLDAVKVGVVGRLVPLEELGVVDEVLHQEIFRALHEIRRPGDFVQRGDRGSQYVEHGEGNLTRLCRIEKADVAERGQRRRQQSGADVDHGHRRAGAQRIEDLHLVRGRRHVDDFGDFGVEPLQRAARRFGVERPGRHVVGAEIIQERTGHGRLADPALVRAHHNHDWLCHGIPLNSSSDRGSGRHAPIPCFRANMAERRENSIP